MNDIHDNYNKIIECDEYKARISYDTQDHIFVGEVLDIDDCISFHSKTEDDAMTSFRKCLDSYRNIKREINVLEKIEK